MISNGTAVLDRRNIGALAGKPVMEGKEFYRDRGRGDGAPERRFRRNAKDAEQVWLVEQV